MARSSKKNRSRTSGMVTGTGKANYKDKDNTAPASVNTGSMDEKTPRSQPTGFIANDVVETAGSDGPGLASGVAVIPMVTTGGGVKPYTKLVSISQASLMEYKDTPWKNKKFGQIVAVDRAKVLTEVLLKPNKTLQQARLVEYINKYCVLLISAFHRGIYDAEIKEYIDDRIEKSAKTKKKKKTTVDSFFLTPEMRLRLYPQPGDDEKDKEDDEETQSRIAGTSEETVVEVTKMIEDVGNSGIPSTASGFHHPPAALATITQKSVGVTGSLKEMSVVTPLRSKAESGAAVTKSVHTAASARHLPTGVCGKRKETPEAATAHHLQTGVCGKRKETPEETTKAATEESQPQTSLKGSNYICPDGSSVLATAGEASHGTLAEFTVPEPKNRKIWHSWESDSTGDEANLHAFYTQMENDGGDPGMDYFGSRGHNKKDPSFEGEGGRTTPVKVNVVCLPAVEDVKLHHREVKKRQVVSDVEDPRKKRFLSDVSSKEQLKLVSDFERKNLRAVDASNAVVPVALKDGDDDDDCMFLKNRSVPSAEDAFKIGLQAVADMSLRQFVLNSSNPRLELAKLGLFDYHVIATKEEMENTELHNLLQKGTNKFVKFVQDRAEEAPNDCVCIATVTASLPCQDDTESLEFEKNGKTYMKNVVHPNKMERAFSRVTEVARRDKDIFNAIHKVHKDLRNNSFLSPDGALSPLRQLKNLLPALLELKEAARSNGMFELEGGVHSTGLVRDLWHELLVTYKEDDHQKFANLVREMLYFGYDAAMHDAVEDMKKAGTK